MNKVIIPIVIAIIAVGALAGFSIYLQQGEAIVAIERVANPNYHCWEKYDYLQQQQAADSRYKFDEENQKISKEMLDADCNGSFREWLPETHPKWDQFIAVENNRIKNCELYVKGELVLKEYEKPIWEKKDCEKFLKDRQK